MISFAWFGVGLRRGFGKFSLVRPGVLPGFVFYTPAAVPLPGSKSGLLLPGAPEERKEGRKEGNEGNEAKKERRKEGKKEGRQAGRKEGVCFCFGAFRVYSIIGLIGFYTALWGYGVCGVYAG